MEKSEQITFCRFVWSTGSDVVKGVLFALPGTANGSRASLDEWQDLCQGGRLSDMMSSVCVLFSGVARNFYVVSL